MPAALPEESRQLLAHLKEDRPPPPLVRVDVAVVLATAHTRFQAREMLVTLPLDQPAVPLLDQLLGPTKSTTEVFEALDRRYREQGKPAVWFLPLSKPISPHLDELLGPATGSTVDLSHLDALPWQAMVETVNGGLVDLSALTSHEGYKVSVKADGAGSVVDLSSLAHFAGSGYPNNSLMEVTNGGRIILPDASIELDKVELSIGRGIWTQATSRGSPMRRCTSSKGAMRPVFFCGGLAPMVSFCSPMAVDTGRGVSHLVS